MSNGTFQRLLELEIVFKRSNPYLWELWKTQEVWEMNCETLGSGDCIRTETERPLKPEEKAIVCRDCQGQGCHDCTYYCNYHQWHFHFNCTGCRTVCCGQEVCFQQLQCTNCERTMCGKCWKSKTLGWDAKAVDIQCVIPVPMMSTIVKFVQ